jgi:hypothetical protein
MDRYDLRWVTIFRVTSIGEDELNVDIARWKKRKKSNGLLWNESKVNEKIERSRTYMYLPVFIDCK